MDHIISHTWYCDKDKVTYQVSRFDGDVVYYRKVSSHPFLEEPELQMTLQKFSNDFEV